MIYWKNFIIQRYNSFKRKNLADYMNSGGGQQVTQLLLKWSNGDQTALDELMPIVYDELRRMVRRYMNRQESGHTMQATELIHEAYL